MILSLILLFVSSYSLASTDYLEGVAHSEIGKITYIEKHKIVSDSEQLNKLIEVSYFKPDSKVPFAFMKSDFQKNRFIPETEFQDLRFKTKITLTINDKTVRFEKFRNEVLVEKSQITLKNEMVASQGFNNFIFLNFDALSASPVNFKFGILNNLDFYDLSGYRITSANQDEITFGINTSSRILRLFVKELSVSYDLKSKKLKTFKGASNILDENEKSQNVIISYSWKSTP